jgi:hypothetical protein
MRSSARITQGPTFFWELEFGFFSYRCIHHLRFLSKFYVHHVSAEGQKTWYSHFLLKYRIGHLETAAGAWSFRLGIHESQYRNTGRQRVGRTPKLVIGTNSSVTLFVATEYKPIPLDSLCVRNPSIRQGPKIRCSAALSSRSRSRAFRSRHYGYCHFLER